MIKGISKSIRAKFKVFAEIREAETAQLNYWAELEALAKLDRRAHLRVIDGGELQ